MEKKEYDTLETMHGVFQTTLNKMHLARKPWQRENPKHLLSVIPGTVVEILVKEGEKVKAGQVIIIYKAMKMNNNIRSLTDNTIKKICVKEGTSMPKNTLLIEFE